MQLNPNKDPFHLMSLSALAGTLPCTTKCCYYVQISLWALYKALFVPRKVLAKKHFFRISTLIKHASFGGWLLIRKTVFQHFGQQNKSTEYTFAHIGRSGTFGLSFLSFYLPQWQLSVFLELHLYLSFIVASLWQSHFVPAKWHALSWRCCIKPQYSRDIKCTILTHIYQSLYI